MSATTENLQSPVTKFIAAEAAKSGNPGAGQPAPGAPFPSGTFTPVPDLIAFELEKPPIGASLDRMRWVLKFSNMPGYFVSAVLLDRSGGYLQPCGRRHS